MMNDPYVTKTETGAYRITGTRVSLDSIVYAYWRGASPEAIADSFPVLTLEEIYGAIAFYLHNQTEIDAYLERSEAEFEELRSESHANSALYRKLELARRLMPVGHS